MFFTRDTFLWFLFRSVGRGVCVWIKWMYWCVTWLSQPSLLCIQKSTAEYSWAYINQVIIHIHVSTKAIEEKAIVAWITTSSSQHCDMAGLGYDRKNLLVCWCLYISLLLVFQCWALSFSTFSFPVDIYEPNYCTQATSKCSTLNFSKHRSV